MQAGLLSHLRDMTILVTDDDPGIRRMIIRALSTEGLLNIIEAENGYEAMQMVERHHPHLIILDLHMPKVSGYDFLETLRQSKEGKDTPVIVQTAVEDTEDKIRAFSLGATDLLTKPFPKQELIARMRVHLDGVRAMSELSAFKERLTYELSVTEMQFAHFLPNAQDIDKIRADYGMKVSVHFKTSSEIGGDFWLVTPISSEKFGILLIDMTGHGVSAAMNAARLQTLLSPFPQFESPGTELFDYLNQRLCDLLPIGHFAAGMWMVFDTKTQTVTVTGAAFPDALIAGQDTLLRHVDGSGLALGTIASAHYTQTVESFHPGEQFVAFSDGLNDSTSQTGQSLSPSTTQTIVTQATANGQDAALEIGTQFDKLFQDAPPSDDSTIISVRYATD